MGIGKRIVVLVMAVMAGMTVQGLADDGEVIRVWNDALREGEDPGGMDTRHLVVVERDREALKVRYLDPSGAEELEEGRWKVMWLLLSGVVMVGEAAMARVETEILCEEWLQKGVGAVVFNVKGEFLRRQRLPETGWMEVEESEKALLVQFCGK